MVALRAAVLLSAIAGVGLRCVCWLMQLLFHFETSKSALERWVKECAAQLPDGPQMAKTLHADKPIEEAHFDEIFAVGQRPKRCTLVLRDEHGRIFAVRQVEERTADGVEAFLRDVRSWGIVPKRFYVDGCEAYRQAIPRVFPVASIQYDYFHVIQNVFKKLWKSVVAHRRQIKADAETLPAETDKERGLALAKRIWESRWSFFKRDKNLKDEERSEMLALLEAEPQLSRVRGFVEAIWDLFDNSDSEGTAKEKLVALKARDEVQPKTAFAKAVNFLEGRFTDMVAFLRDPAVKRNSLAETGIRCLRRLEQGHDGFRDAAGLDCYVRLYQAIKYCGWTVHRFSPGLGLPPREPLAPPGAS
jgi:hypothetical protein